MYPTKSILYPTKSIRKTDFESNIENILSLIPKKNIPISVYTDEFDLSMLRLFFPQNSSKLGYISNSIAFTDGEKLNIELFMKHQIVIIRNNDKDKQKILDKLRDKTEKIKNIGNYIMFYLNDDELIEEGKEELNSLTSCDYICTLFPPKKDVDFSKLQITTIGVYSITSYKSNNDIVKMISDKVGNNITIMDCTSCVGGDTIGFALNFNFVISIEKDPINYGALVNNIFTYKLTNVSYLNIDFTKEGMEIIKNRKPEVVYFDPPWGGKDYHDHDNLDLFLGDYNIKEIINNIIDDFIFVKLIVVKVPSNYNYNGIYDINGTVEVKKLKKFHVILISKK
jgi:hypothetical protein